ncbi:ABC transporter substrate-binding protein [Arthrobacter sp. MMS18-M83]|uniref:ABC transporter substrate-binding protein n=1 Tax=Arthrobacter sp. MMS18-M83 TaxID=2996261 RepID=UPI00227D147C|nr:ABC transporter substrate-binding protein [Arthrobacter sp. MMS18-M83]WAH97452.1 ABC transporter substrate-binding protein [Arthrobacter sp. MMS18-M83]
MLFKSTPIVAAAALALALAGCSGSPSGGPQQASKNLTLGNVSTPTTFDASNTRWANDSIYLQAVYDTLVKIAPNGTDVQPSLATKWSYNADETVLTMTLRSDVKFTDGTPFTADVAAQNLLRYKQGTGSLAVLLTDVTDAKATDATTLVITLKQADPALLVVLGQAPGLEESPKAFGSATAKTVPVGSGPYTLNSSQTVVGSSYVFDRNPNYWDSSSVHYDSITVKVYNDPTSLLNALRGKQLDAAAVTDNTTIDQIKAAGYTVNSQELNFSGLMLLDRDGKLNPALANVKVRQAINYAIDANAMLKAVDKGYGTLTEQVFRPGSRGYDKSLDSTYNYDPSKARQLLAEAGYPNGFTLSLPTSSVISQSLWPLLQQQLQDVGIKVNLTDVGAAPNYISALLGQKYPAAFFPLRRDPSDWLNIQNLISPSAVWNPMKHSDPKVNSLISTIQTTTGDTQAAVLKQLNQYIVQQAWFDVWYAPTLNYVTNSTTSATINNGNAYPYLWDIKPKA